MTKGVSLRGFSGSHLLLSPRCLALGPGGNAGLKALITLVGAGTVGAIIIFKYVPGFSLSRSPSPTPKSVATDSILEENKLTVPGLQNTGNNCFLNVILQALASSRALLSFMELCAELTSGPASVSQVTGTTDRISMPLAVAVSSLIKDLSELGSVQRTASPRRVMLALGLYVRHFDLACQQDAAEGLIHLASALQEERSNYLQWLRPTLHSFVKAPVIGETYSSTGDPKDCKGVKGGDQLLDSWREHLPWPLEGTLASFLTCQRCGYQFSTQFQSFNDITLTPLRDREGKMIRSCTLEGCLDHFTRQEWVDNVKCSNCSHKAALLSLYLKKSSESRSTAVTSGTDAHKISAMKLKSVEECGCDEDCNCEVFTREEGGIWRNIYTHASKQLRIGRSPEVLCFQIQRVVMGQDGSMKKLTGHVAFPRVLDLFPFTVTAKDSTPLRLPVKRGPGQELQSRKLQSSSSQISSTKDTRFVNTPSLFLSELSCKGGAELGVPTSEDFDTAYPRGKEGNRVESTDVELLPASANQKRDDELVASTGSPPISNLSSKESNFRESLLVGFLENEVQNRIAVEETVHQSKIDLEETGTQTLLVEDSELLPVNDSTLDLLGEAELDLQGPPMVLVAEDPSMTTAQPSGIMHNLIDRTTPSSIERIPIVEQVSYDLCEPERDSQNVLQSNCRGEGEGLSSQILQSIYLQYTPRVFPQILQQLSLGTTFDAQHLSLGDPAQKSSGFTTVPRSNTSLMPRCSIYSRELLYELVSVVVHQGGPQNGHYLVYRKVKVPENGRRATNKDERSVNEIEREIESAQTSSGQSAVEHIVRTVESIQLQRTNGDSFEESTNLIRKGNVDGLWFRVSDTNVQRVQEQEVLSAHASLLFYEQL